MNPVYADILSNIKSSEKLRNSRFVEVYTQTDEALLRKLFRSYRAATSERGMRLTHYGHLILQNLYATYLVPCGKEALTSRNIIYLDGIARLPYYVASQSITLYDSDLAMWLKLADGDVSILSEINPSSR